MLIEKIKSCSTQDELFEELRQIQTWVYGKCDLLNWADVLDKLDEVLEHCCGPMTGVQSWSLACDQAGHERDRLLLLAVLQFSSLLIEHSFTRHLYSSMEHLTLLLSSSDMTVVLAVIDVLYIFSKRSNFITLLAADKKQALILRLLYLAESWGDKENGFGLAVCCQDLMASSYPASATTLHFEYYEEHEEGPAADKRPASHVMKQIHVPSLDQSGLTLTQHMQNFTSKSSIPKDKQMQLFTRVRLAMSFSDYKSRLQCVQARLQAICVLAHEHLNTILYEGFVEELIDVLELKESCLTDIKAMTFRTLTAVVRLDRNKLSNIIDATGVSLYHGFLPVMMRTCIQHMTDTELKPFPQPLTMALFSFLYHLASYDNGGKALISCGIMEALLRVISWMDEGNSHDCITIVTWAVRVVDLVTNLDMQCFQTHGGMTAFINRLEHEVDVCRKEQPHVIRPHRIAADIAATNSESQQSTSPGGTVSDTRQAMSPGTADTWHMSPGDADTEQTVSLGVSGVAQTMSPDVSAACGPAEFLANLTSAEEVQAQETDREGATEKTYPLKVSGIQCFPQRADLLKSMLNVLKKAIPDTAFSDSIRHLMDSSLPRSLKHIISNAEYYGPSLFLLAKNLVYIFQPSMLSYLQTNRLTDIVHQALLSENETSGKGSGNLVIEKRKRENERIAEEESAQKECKLSCCNCEDEITQGNSVLCETGHVTCSACVQELINVYLGQGKLQFQCPNDLCHALYDDATIAKLTQPGTLDTITRKRIEQRQHQADFLSLGFDPDKCRLCAREVHYPMPCASLVGMVDLNTFVDMARTNAVTRVCWKCGTRMLRNGGCNNVTCETCHASLCYICSRPVLNEDHYNSGPCQEIWSSSSGMVEADHRGVADAAAAKARALYLAVSARENPAPVPLDDRNVMDCEPDSREPNSANSAASSRGTVAARSQSQQTNNSTNHQRRRTNQRR
jgi:hypothetical protein